MPTQDNDWQYLKKQLGKRSVEPLSDLPFIFYMITGVVLFGGLGIWAEIMRWVMSSGPFDIAGLITAVITFFPALIGSTTLQLILASSNRPSADKILISFALLVLCVFSAFGIVLPLISNQHPVGVLVVGSLCSVASVWIWWITNGLDPTFKSHLEEAVGGSTEKDPVGTLDGWQV